MDTEVLLAGIAIASAAAVVLRMAWRGRAREDAAALPPPANTVAEPVDTVGSSFGWMLRVDPNVAYALLELGHALSQSATQAESDSLGSTRIFGPSIVRGTDLRKTMAVRPSTGPTAVLTPARSPDALRTYLEALEGDDSAKWDARIEALIGVR